MAGPVTDNEAFGDHVPSDEDVFGKEEHQSSFGGKLMDGYFSMAQPESRVMDAFGQGAKDGWGYVSQLDKGTQDELTKLGLDKDYHDNHGNLAKAFGSAFIREAVHLGYGVAQPIIAGMGAIGAAGTQYGTELRQGAGAIRGLTEKSPVVSAVTAPISAVMGEAGEALQATSSGQYFGEIGIPLYVEHANRIREANLNTARAVGAIGESPETFLGSVPPTEAEQTTRAEATGALPSTPAPVPNIHELARSVSPDTFYDYDILKNKNNLLLDNIRATETARNNDPRVKAANDEIARILGPTEDRSKLSKGQITKLSEIRGDLEAFLDTDTPEMTAAKEVHAKNYHEMQDMLPDVRAAYKEAQSRIPSSEPLQGPQTAMPEEGSTSTTEVPGKPSGIAQNVSEKLQAAGRPKKEAVAAGEIVQARYQALANRFNGKLGTADEVYAKYGPKDITDQQKPLTPSTADLFQEELKASSNVIDLGERRFKKQEAKTEEEIKEPELTSKELFDQSISAVSSVINKAIMHDFPGLQAKWVKLADFLNEHGVKAFEDEDLYAEVQKLEKDGNDAVALINKNMEKSGANVVPFPDHEFFQGERGALTFEKDARTTIRIFKSADASTAMHEFAHQWLEELTTLSDHPEAPERLKNDYQTVKQWLGVKNEITRAQHERFARGFERYLMEGIAPSRELESVFEKFKNWLTQIYKRVKNLNSPINDNIRGVFDRLLTDEQDTQRTIIAPEEAATESFATTDQFKAPTPVSEGTEQIKPEGSPETAASPLKKDTEYLQQDGSFHLENIDSYPALIAGLKQYGELNDLRLRAMKGNVSDQDLIDISDTSGLNFSRKNLDKLAAATIDDNVSMSTRLYGLKEMFNQNASKIRETLSAENPSDEDILALASQITLHQRMAETLLGVRGEWGRTGRVLNKMLKDASNEGELSALLQQSVGLDYYQMQRVFKQSKALKTTQQISKLARDIQKPSFGQNLVAYWMNNLVSGLLTHATYAEQISMGIISRAVIESPMSAAVGSIRRVLGNESPERVTWGETRDELHGAWVGARKGIQALVAARRSGTQQGLQIGDTQIFGKVYPGLISDKVSHEIETGIIQPGSRAGRVEQLTTKVQEFKSRYNLSDIDKDIKRVYEGKDPKIPSEFNEIFPLLAKGEPPQAFDLNPSNAKNLRPKLGDQPDSSNAARIAGNIMRAPGEQMVAPIHSMNYTVSFSSNLDKLNSRQARLEGETNGWNDTQVAVRKAQLDNDTPWDNIKEAKRLSLEENYLNPAKYGSYEANFKRFINTQVKLYGLGDTPLLAFPNPFVSIVSKVFKAGTKMIALSNPLSPVTALLYKDIRDGLRGKNGKVAQDLSIAKMALGAATFSSIWGLKEAGLINDPPATDPKERFIQQMYTGLPYGVRIGDMTADTQRLGPMGMRIAAISSMHHFKDSWEKDGFNEAVTVLMHDLGHTLSGATAVTGLGELYDAVTDPGRYGKYYWNNFISTLGLPFSIGFWQLAKVTDPYQRETQSGDNAGAFSFGEWNSLSKSFEEKIPGLREARLYPKIDVFGQPIPSPEFYGVYIQKTSDDPVYRAFEGTGYFPGKLDGHIKGYTLDEKQYFEYATLVGQQAHRLMTQTVNMPGFEKMIASIRHRLLVTDMNIAKQQGLAAMETRYPELPKMSVALKKEITELQEQQKGQ